MPKEGGVSGREEERVMGAIKAVARKFGFGGVEVCFDGLFAEVKRVVRRGAKGLEGSHCRWTEGVP